MSKLYCKVIDGKIQEPSKLPSSASSITDYGETINPSSLPDEVLAKHFGFYLYIRPEFDPKEKTLGDLMFLPGRQKVTNKLKNLVIRVSDEKQDMRVLLRRALYRRLAESDWYVIRKFETGKEIPKEVEKSRKTIRDNGELLMKAIDKLRDPRETLEFKEIFLSKIKNI